MRDFRRNQGSRLALPILILALAAPIALAEQVYTPRDLWDDLDRQVVAERVDRWVEAAVRLGALDQVWSEAEVEARGYGELAVEALAARALSADPAGSRAAVGLLARLGGALAAPALIETTRRSADPELRLMAMRLLIEGNAYSGLSRLLAQRSSEESDPEVVDYLRAVLLRARVAPRRERVADTGLESVPAAPVDPRALETIRGIVAAVLERGTLRHNGEVMAITRSHPHPEDRRQVLALGPSAIPALATYARTEVAFDWIVVRVFLRDLGGTAVVEQLAAAASDHPDSWRRISLLSTLVDGGNFVAISRALQEASRDGQHPPLAEYAQGILEAGGF